LISTRRGDSCETPRHENANFNTPHHIFTHVLWPFAKIARGQSTYTVRDDAVNAMLLNEFLKEHRKVQEQQRKLDFLKAELKKQGS
jgi:hypothetical protein